MAQQYPRGLVSEVDPQLLRPGQFATFRNLTQKEGWLRPTAADGTLATASWEEQQLGTSIVSEPFSVNSTSGFLVYVAQAGGAPLFRSPAGTDYTLAWAASTEAPGTVATYSMATGGLLYGGTRTYAAAWTADNGYHTSLSDTLTLEEVSVYAVFLGTRSTVDPTVGDVFTIGTGTSGEGTATVVGGTWGALTHEYLLLSGLSGTFASGSVGYWGTGGTGTLDTAAVPVSDLHLIQFSRNDLAGFPPTVGNVLTGTAGTGTVFETRNTTTVKHVYLTGVTGSYGTSERLTWGTTGTVWGNVETYSRQYIAPHLDSPGTAYPTGITGCDFYALEDTGTWRKVSTTDTTTDLADADAYDGPLDSNGLPETLVAPGTCQTVAIHKGCLFLGEGNLLRWSEGAIDGVEYRWFRDGFTIDAGAEIWALIPRTEWMEVWTALGLWFVVGSSPYFEVRKFPLAEAPVSRYSILACGPGTFYHANDGLRLFTGDSCKPVSQGVCTPWFTSLASPTTTVAGAADGVLYLTNSAGGCLVYDWESQEFRDRTFSAQPSGFRWNSTTRQLIAKIAATYLTVETDTATAVAWSVQLPTVANRGGIVKLPHSLWADIDGSFQIDVYTDDTLSFSGFVHARTPRRQRIPGRRGSRWYAVLSGTATTTSFRMHGMNWSKK